MTQYSKMLLATMTLTAVSAAAAAPAVHAGDWPHWRGPFFNGSRKDFGPFAFQWTFSSSPTLYNGKVYLINFNGQVAIFTAACGKLLRVIPMDQETTGRDPIRASISAAYGQLFIRTTRKLYCVGKAS